MNTGSFVLLWTYIWPFVC